MALNFVRNLFTQMAVGKRSNLFRSSLFYSHITLVCFQKCFVDTSSRECAFGIQRLNILPRRVGDYSCQTIKVAASGLHAFVCRAVVMSSLLTPSLLRLHFQPIFCFPCQKMNESEALRHTFSSLHQTFNLTIINSQHHHFKFNLLVNNPTTRI